MKLWNKIKYLDVTNLFQTIGKAVESSPRLKNACNQRQKHTPNPSSTTVVLTSKQLEKLWRIHPGWKMPV